MIDKASPDYPFVGTEGCRWMQAFWAVFYVSRVNDEVVEKNQSLSVVCIWESLVQETKCPQSTFKG